MKKGKREELGSKRAILRMRDGGRGVFGEELGFEEEERESFGLVEGRRRRVGSAQGRFSNKRKCPKDLVKNYKFTLGSILGVDSWHREIQKNNETILKKFKILGEGCLPKN